MNTTRDGAVRALDQRFAGDSVSHLWSDALFARRRARESDDRSNAPNKQGKDLANALQEVRRNQNLWERGSFVRWTVSTAWSTMEQLFKVELGLPSLHGIPAVLEEKMLAKGFIPIQSLSPLWLRIDGLRRERNAFTHGSLTYQQRMAPLDLADQAIRDCRSAVLDSFSCIGRTAPSWIHQDDVPGNVPTSIGVLSVSGSDLHAAGDPVRIVAIFGGEEFGSRELRGDEDPYPHVQQMIESSIVPLDGVRIYRGQALEDEFVARERGSA